VQERDGALIDNVDAALTRAVNNGVKNLVVQPTHLMHGLEYDELVNKVAQYSDAFEKVVISEPLLSSDNDFARVEKAITECTSEYDDGKTAICFMGHGTEADSNEVYQKLQNLLTADGYANYFVGTVEAEPSLADVLAAVQAGDYERVVLEPLMVVAGDHANNDMAGDDEDSWKSTFEKSGYEVVCLIRGLGENKDIRQIYIDHAKTAIDSLTERKNRMMKYRLVIFDMDGTILNTLEDLADSLNHVLSTHGYPKQPLKNVRNFVGNGIRKLIERAVPSDTPSDTIDRLFEDFLPYYQQHCADKTKPYDGILKLLEDLRTAGCKTAVVSNKANTAVLELCAQYFEHCFDMAVGERTGVRKKPAPDSVNEVVKDLQIPHSEAVYIGDSDVDIETAKNAGMDCIIVNWGFRDTEFLKEHGAKIIVSSPDEIKKIIL
jgi:2-phosphoglycolate phosphatase